MNNTRVSVLIELFKQAHAQTLKSAQGVPETHRLKQLQEGKATPLWLLGHLTRTVDRIVLVWTLDRPAVIGDALGQRFAPAHVGGIAPTPNPEDYPAWDDLVGVYDTVMRQAIEGVAVLNDADLDKPLPGDLPPDYRERFPTIGTALRLVINHDAYHRGQIGLLGKLA